MPIARRWRGTTLEQGPHTWGPYAASVRADSPLLYYRLTEPVGSTKAIDNSGFGNNCNISNVTLGQVGAFPVSEPLTTAASFNGSNSDVSLLTNFRSAQLTLEGWVRTTAAWPGSKRDVIAFFGTNLLANELFINNGVLECVFVIAGSNITFNSSTSVGIGTWNHVVATYDTANVKMYLNGVNVFSTAQTGALNITGTGGNIGDNASTNTFQGQIQDVAAYGTALSPTRVLAHFNAGFTQPIMPVPPVKAARHYTPGHSFTKRAKTLNIPHQNLATPPTVSRKKNETRVPFVKRRYGATPPWLAVGAPTNPYFVALYGQRKQPKVPYTRRGKVWNIPWYQAALFTNGYTLPSLKTHKLLSNRFWLRHGKNWTPPYVPPIIVTGSWFPPQYRGKQPFKLTPRRSKLWSPTGESFRLSTPVVNWAQGNIVIQLIGQGTTWQTGVTIWNITQNGVGFASESIVINSPTSATWTISLDFTGTNGTVNIDDSTTGAILQVVDPSFLYGVLRNLSKQKYTYTHKAKTWDAPKQSWKFVPNTINFAGGTYIVQLVGSGTQWDPTLTNWNIVASNVGLAASSFVVNGPYSVTWTFQLSNIFPGNFQVDDGLSSAVLTVLDQVMLWSKIGKPPVGYKQFGRRSKQWQAPIVQAFPANPGYQAFKDTQFRIHRAWQRRGKTWAPLLVQSFNPNPVITFQDRQFRVHRLYTRRGKAWTPYLQQSSIGINPNITFQGKQFRIHRLYTRRGHTWSPHLDQAYPPNPVYQLPNYYQHHIPWLGMWRRKGKFWEPAWPQSFIVNPNITFQDKPARIHRAWQRRGKSWAPFLAQAFPPNPPTVPYGVRTPHPVAQRQWQRRGKLWIPVPHQPRDVPLKRRQLQTYNNIYMRRGKIWNPYFQTDFSFLNPRITDRNGRRNYPRNYPYVKKHNIWTPVPPQVILPNPGITDLLGRRAYPKNYPYAKRHHIWTPFLPQSFSPNPIISPGFLHTREIPIQWRAPRRGYQTFFGLGLTIEPVSGPPALYIANDEILALYLAFEDPF